jgi:putative transposase
MKIGELCKVFDKTRQGYYAIKADKDSIERDYELVLIAVRKQRKDLPKSGVRKLHLDTRKELLLLGITIGRDELFELLRRENMLVRRKRTVAVTTDSKHSDPKYPNQIVDFVPTSAGQLWVADITYLHTRHGFIYLFLITDAYSRKIVGYCLSNSLKTEGALVALQMAQRQWIPIQGVSLIHHSDRGSQYCSKKYVEAHAQGTIISMTENSDPRENAIAERVNGILKTEWFDEMRFVNLEQTMPTVDKVINTYNTRRRHSSCDMMTPEQAHLETGLLKKHWKNYYAIKRQKQMEEKLIEEQNLRVDPKDETGQPIGVPSGE